jgi:hypothetical protein
MLKEAVVTAFKLQARKYPQHILGGTIIFPESSLEAVSKGVAYFATGITDPRVSMHVYFLEPRNPFFPFPAGIGLMIFDANGEEHGRSEHGFKWAFDIEGAVDLTKEMTLFDVHDATGMISLHIINQVQENMLISADASLSIFGSFERSNRQLALWCYGSKY